jgi:uncharacterized protein (DUF1697 family)
MKTYFSILRGINVSGQKSIKMADLKAIYESLGFSNVQTYIQSGNVVFNSTMIDCNEIIKVIQFAILEQYNFDVPVFVFTIQDLDETIDGVELMKLKQEHFDKLHVTFLSSIPHFDLVNKLKEFDFSPDFFVIKENVIYVYCPNGYGKTKLSNTFFENKLKISATTRNWKSVHALKDLYQQYFLI